MAWCEAGQARESERERETRGHHSCDVICSNITFKGQTCFNNVIHSHKCLFFLQTNYPLSNALIVLPEAEPEALGDGRLWWLERRSADRE